MTDSVTTAATAGASVSWSVAAPPPTPPATTVSPASRRAPPSCRAARPATPPDRRLVSVTAVASSPRSSRSGRDRLGGRQGDRLGHSPPPSRRQRVGTDGPAPTTDAPATTASPAPRAPPASPPARPAAPRRPTPRFRSPPAHVDHELHARVGGWLDRRQVTDSVTTAAISGASVSVAGGARPPTPTPTGNYSLTGVAPGTASVTASKTGYTAQTDSLVAVTAGATTTRNYAPGGDWLDHGRVTYSFTPPPSRRQRVGRGRSGHDDRRLRQRRLTGVTARHRQRHRQQDRLPAQTDARSRSPRALGDQELHGPRRRPTGPRCTEPERIDESPNVHLPGPDLQRRQHPADLDHSRDERQRDHGGTASIAITLHGAPRQPYTPTARGHDVPDPPPPGSPTSTSSSR